MKATTYTSEKKTNVHFYYSTIALVSLEKMREDAIAEGKKTPTTLHYHRFSEDCVENKHEIFGK